MGCEKVFLQNPFMEYLTLFCRRSTMKKLYGFSGIISFLVLLLTVFPLTIFAQSQNVTEVEARLLKEAAENIEKYRKGDVLIRFITETGDPVPDATVEVRQTSHDFLFGAKMYDLVRPENLSHPDLYKRRFMDLFNFAVLPFYWYGYEPNQGMPKWEKMLPVIEWAESNGITLKGHNLLWAHHYGAPGWLADYTVTETEELLKARILNIVNCFEGHVDVWDVVNEPVNAKTWKHKLENLDDKIDWGKEEPISEIVDYVEPAFAWANRANPAAHLILNEYYQIARMDVRERFYNLVKELQKRGTPVRGLGIQAHEPRQEWYNPQDIWDTFNYLAELGLPLHVTEIMAESSGKEITGGWRTGTWTEGAQADFAEQIYRLSFGHPAMMSIVWWGFNDRGKVRGRSLITADYRPKPVYDRLRNLIHKEWKTALSTSVNRQGMLQFRGFYGDYAITVKTTEGIVRTFTIHLDKNEENTWVFTLKQ